MNKKVMWKLEDGDKVVINRDIFVIVNKTAKQYKVQRYTSDGSNKSDFKHVMIDSGRVTGERTYANVLDISVDEFYSKVKTAQDEKAAKEKEREDAWQQRLSAVIAANIGIIKITDEGLGLSKAIMVNSKGDRMMVYFTAEKSKFWTTYSEPAVDGYRINAHTWCDDYGRYNFSSSHAEGTTIENALCVLVAHSYWNS